MPFTQSSNLLQALDARCRGSTMMLPFTDLSIGERLRRDGLVIAHQSDYLVERNWFQVSLMGGTLDPASPSAYPALTDRESCRVKEA